ncbi:MAG TPA: PLP-dependent aspartate aminotransferase family protein [Verrucomicrobiota bacterium]|jgi:cystathionine beta-lyase/cystathionine gamma-synthase|nr:PLP-dependent aspartate aminotransferase family protein [Verrucomicrobiota bacterium]HRT07062.1 PLP-dependent aspartate aminotransferase family protein [Candidatus Paceibacterota bacterium]HRT56555.1 PLP-dependent aspartate aminotransferase family protein [Candidatus Paceibacterota bacterium]
MRNQKTAGFSTRGVHGGRGFSGTTGAVMPPVYLTSTFESGNPDGFDYTRSGNPNFRLLQESVAALEGARHATCFASGVSAITAVVSTLRSGDLVLAEENLYGCTYRLFERVFAKFGLRTQYLDLSQTANWEAIPRLRPALIWLESPTNPLLKILDIEGISRAGAAAGAPVLVDNTFASPYLQRPLELGATLSLSSTTKYINGHSDCLGGVVATNDAEWQEKMIFAQKALGLQPSPFDAWLTTRGQRTLALRMERHCSNALELACWLEKQPGVRLVRHPFLRSHPQYELAKRQMRGGSGLIVIELDCSAEAALVFCRRLRLFTLAESLGGVESLVCHPATMTHASVPAEVRRKVGIGDGLLRLSVGVEDVEDLRSDLEEALQAVLQRSES